MKRFAFLFGLFLCLMLLFTACQGEETTAPITTTTPTVTTTTAPEVVHTANVFAVAKLSGDDCEREPTVLHNDLNFKTFIANYRQYFLYGDISHYDEAFFEKNFLIAIPMKTTSSTDRPYVASLTLPKELSVSMGIHTTENRDNEPWEWLALVEVSCDDVIKSKRRAEVTYLPIETISDDSYRTQYPESLERTSLSGSFAAYRIGCKIDIELVLGAELIQTYEEFLIYKQELIDQLVFDSDADLPFARYDEAFFEDYVLVGLLTERHLSSHYYLKDVIYANETVTVFLGSHARNNTVIPSFYYIYVPIEIERSDTFSANKVVLRYTTVEYIGDLYDELYPNE